MLVTKYFTLAIMLAYYVSAAMRRSRFVGQVCGRGQHSASVFARQIVRCLQYQNLHGTPDRTVDAVLAVICYVFRRRCHRYCAVAAGRARASSRSGIGFLVTGKPSGGGCSLEKHCPTRCRQATRSPRLLQI